MADLTQTNYRALVRLIIRGPGGIEISTKPGSELGPIFLNGGSTEILTGADVGELFRTENLNFIGLSLAEYQRNAALPEGVYQFHFEIRDFNNPNITVSNTNTGFSTAWLILNDPPILNKPQNNATLEPQTVQNIFFQWTPRHTGSPNAAFSTEYKLELVEIYPSERNANDAMLTTQPIFETTTFATAYNYSITDPNLIEGRWYAFRVKAQDTENRDFFKNSGYSEVFKFYYGKACPLPTIAVEQISSQSLRLSWADDPMHSFYRIRYRPKTEEITITKKRFLSSKEVTTTKTKEYPWITTNSTNNELFIEIPDPTQDYEYQIQGLCAQNESEWSSSYFFNSSYKHLEEGEECTPPMQDGFIASLSNEGTNMTWSAWPKFTNYILKYRKVGSEGWNEISTSGNEITEEQLDPESVYEYTLSYICTDGSKVEGSYGTFTLNIAESYVPQLASSTGWCFPPDNILEKTVNDSTVSITWDKVENALAYQVDYKKSDGSEHWQKTDIIKANTIEISSLASGSTYEYRIKTQCNEKEFSDVSETHYFETREAYTYNGPCETPEKDTAQAISATMARALWQGKEYHSGYKIEIRKEEAPTWHVYESSDTVKTITGLSPLTTYEYRVAGACGTAYSNYTPIATFKTLEAGKIAEGEFICGIGDTMLIQNKTPIEELEIGDKFNAADYELEVTLLESGVPYNGEATVKFPYFNNARITLKMVNVSINTDNQMYGGYLYMLSADVILYELPPSGRLAQALAELNKISGNYLDNLSSLDAAFSEILKALEEFPDIKQAIGDAINAIKAKLSKAKEAKEKGDKTKGESFAKQALDMLKDLAGKAIQALADAPKAIAEALDQFHTWVKEVLEDLKVQKEKAREELSKERANLWAQITAFFDDLFDFSGGGEISQEDVKRVYTKTLDQKFTEEEYNRFKADLSWANWNNLVELYRKADIDYDKAVKFYNYAEVFLFPGNIEILADKLKDDLGGALLELGKGVLAGGDIKEKAKLLIKELLISNIDELVEETPTTDVTAKVDDFFRKLETGEGISN